MWSSVNKVWSCEESLPNATWGLGTETYTYGGGTAYIKASTETSWKADNGNNRTYQKYLNYSLNHASSVYRDNAHVTPLSQKTKFIIKF